MCSEPADLHDEPAWKIWHRNMDILEDCIAAWQITFRARKHNEISLNFQQSKVWEAKIWKFFKYAWAVFTSAIKSAIAERKYRERLAARRSKWIVKVTRASAQ